jgi:hypothetical protein
MPGRFGVVRAQCVHEATFRSGCRNRRGSQGGKAQCERGRNTDATFDAHAVTLCARGHQVIRESPKLLAANRVDVPGDAQLPYTRPSWPEVFGVTNSAAAISRLVVPAATSPTRRSDALSQHRLNPDLDPASSAPTRSVHRETRSPSDELNARCAMEGGDQ